MATATTPADDAAPTSGPLSLGDRLHGWREILETANPPSSGRMDAFGKWLVITRAAVFPMTIWSGLIGVLLAVGVANTVGGVTVNALYATVAVVGLVDGARREQHDQRLLRLQRRPRHRGLRPCALRPASRSSRAGSSRATLRNAILAVSLLDGLIMLYLAAAVSPLIIVFALAGLFVSVFYVAPPIRLKWHGLGEPGVFLVWGPLMIGGTYLATTGTIPPWVLVFSVPYALLVTSVLFGKHIDKILPDAALGIRTLPVILGEARARVVGQWLMILFYPLVVLAVLGGWVGPWILLVVLAIPRLVGVLKVFGQPKPARATARLPRARLAALVRRLRLHPHPPRRRPADPRPVAQRGAAPHAALAEPDQADRSRTLRHDPRVGRT